jgi:hypothetical protein
MSHLTGNISKFDKDGKDKDRLLERILEDSDCEVITTDIYKHFQVSDKVVVFYNGKVWSIISLYNMLCYPVFYFDFWSEKDNETYKNTLLVCPITMRSMIYKGKIKILNVINDRLFLLNTDTGDEFLMDTPFTGHYDDKGKEKKIKSHVKRYEVKILSLRDAFTFLLDPSYIIVKKEKVIKPVINLGYYTNRFTHDGLSIYTAFHPKTIVYMIQYYSHHTKDYRYTVIVGRDINRETPTGYNYRASGLWDFITKHLKDLIDKKAYIYPIFWFMIDKLYKDKDVKMIMIT